jgi:hypothetical protein
MKILMSLLVKQSTTWVRACLLKTIDDMLREHAT